jgi:hypothetical protein
MLTVATTTGATTLFNFIATSSHRAPQRTPLGTWKPTLALTTHRLVVGAFTLDHY